jgi:MFS family permease
VIVLHLFYRIVQADLHLAQLLTIPVFVWATIVYLIVAFCSDRVGKRVVFMVPAAVISIIGYSILLSVSVSNTPVLYFALFLVSPGVYIIVGLNVVWLLNSHAGYHKRATAIGMNQTIGNTAGIVVSLSHSAQLLHNTANMQTDVIFSLLFGRYRPVRSIPAKSTGATLSAIASRLPLSAWPSWAILPCSSGSAAKTKYASA